MLRVGVVTVAGELGERPLLAAVLGVVGAGVVAGAVGSVVAGSVARSLLLRRPDPLALLMIQTGRRAAPALPGALTADGRAELEMLALAAFVRSSAPGRQIPTLRPVPDAARLLFGFVPPAGPTALLLRADPPQLPAPRTMAEVLGNVAASYDREPTPFAPGTPEGVISVQQLTHPDGTRTWVIEIPGTEDWDLNGDNAMDTTTGRTSPGRPGRTT